jgi:hypothetical protein
MRRSLPFPAEIPATNAAASSAPGTPLYNPSWYAYTDIWLDPVNGNDNNVGGSSGAQVPAVKTVAEIVRRYGSWTPEHLSSNLTIHQLSSQTIGVDLFVFDPIMGANTFVWDALSYAPAVGSTFSPVSVTALSQANPGSDWILNGNLPVGATPGLLVWNKTKGSYAFVDAVAGGDATVTQPIWLTPPPQAYPTFVEDATWASTDVYQLLQPLGINWLRLRPTGGPINGLTPPIQGVAWIQGVHFYDQTGTPGSSQMSVHPIGTGADLWLCSFDPFALLDGPESSDVTAISCFFNGGMQLTTNALMCGGCSNTSGNSETILVGGNVQMNTILHGLATVSPGWENSFIEAHVLGTLVVEPGATITCEPGAVFWGAGTINVRGPGAINITAGANTFTSVFKVATLQLDGATTGSSFNASAVDNPYTAGITITAANLATGGGGGNPGLQNPRTGSRYAST